MNPNKKVFITFLSMVLVFVVVACSCTSLIPNNLLSSANNIISSGASSSEAIPGLAGMWQDPETGDTFTIVWQTNQYLVAAVTWESSNYPITSQSWINSKLTWSYYDDDLAVTVTYSTSALRGDALDVNWSYSSGQSGTETLNRVQ